MIAQLEERLAELTAARERFATPGVKLISSVQRCDCTKNVDKQILAMESLLDEHPELYGRRRLVIVGGQTRKGISAFDEAF